MFNNETTSNVDFFCPPAPVLLVVAMDSVKNFYINPSKSLMSNIITSKKWPITLLLQVHMKRWQKCRPCDGDGLFIFNNRGVFHKKTIVTVGFAVVLQHLFYILAVDTAAVKNF